MDEARLTEIEALLDRETVWSEMTVEELVGEVRRLRGWLRGMVDATVRVEEPCDWCVELQGWAVEALTGTPFDAAVARGDEGGEGDGC